MDYNDYFKNTALEHYERNMASAKEWRAKAYDKKRYSKDYRQYAWETSLWYETMADKWKFFVDKYN